MSLRNSFLSVLAPKSRRGSNVGRTESFKKKSTQDISGKSKNNLSSKDKSTHDISEKNKNNGSDASKPRRGSKVAATLTASVQSDTHQRRGSTTHQASSYLTTKSPYDPNLLGPSQNSSSRRGSVAENQRRGSIVQETHPRKESIAKPRSVSTFVTTTQKVNAHQILMLKEIHNESHVMRMIQFSGDLIPRYMSPLDDLVTLTCPDANKNEKSVPQILGEIYHLAGFQRYVRSTETIEWTRNEEAIEDILAAFANKAVDFNSKAALEILLDSLASQTIWATLERGVADLYTLFAPDPQYQAQKDTMHGSRSHILKQLYVLLGNWTWSTRMSHVALCKHITKWFDKYSEKEWSECLIPVVFGAFNTGQDVVGLFARLKNNMPTLNLIKMNLLFAEIAKGIQQFPNQRDFLSLDLLRHFMEFREQIKVMVNLLHLCRKMDGDKDSIWKALDMFSVVQLKKDQPRSIFEKISRARQGFAEMSKEFDDINTPADFITAFEKKMKNQFKPIFDPFRDSLASTSAGSIKHPILPSVLAKTSQERAFTEALVTKVMGRKNTMVIPEISIPDGSEDDYDDGSMIPEIAIQMDGSLETLNLPVIQTLIPEEPTAVQPIRRMSTRDSFARRQSLTQAQLPESICKQTFKIAFDDLDIIETLFEKSVGNLGWKDLIKILENVGCTITSSDGMGAFVRHSKSGRDFYMRTPHPDSVYKTYEINRIKCIFQDYLGIYFENFTTI